MNWLTRLLPEVLRKREVLADEQRAHLFAGVGDNDPCLRAVLDRLQGTLETEFHVAIDPTRSDTEKLRACEGLRVSYYNLQFIENERTAAVAARKAEQEQARKK